MKPTIDATRFGSITVEGTQIDHDVVVRLSGAVEKRKKQLSLAVYGTAHVISLDEAKDLLEAGVSQIVIGSGQDGRVTLSPEAAAFFKKRGVKVSLEPTPIAIRTWNAAKGAAAGLFHVTC
jgi:hypothetical protein